MWDQPIHCYYSDESHCDFYLITETEIQDGICEACNKRMNDLNKVSLLREGPLKVDQLLSEFLERNSIANLLAENQRLRDQLNAKPKDPDLTLDSYQETAMETARFGPVRHASVLDFMIGFEAMGVIAERAKKTFRDRESVFTTADTETIKTAIDTIVKHANMANYIAKMGVVVNPEDKGQEIIYPLFGLIGEAGEVAGKLIKVVQGKELNDNDRFEIVKELGDVMWYIAALAKLLGADLSDVAGINIDKLRDRRDRKQIHGDGDNR
jgi:NTP pyrophosphatase (non-canonical NTP hydrolase)